MPARNFPAPVRAMGGGGDMRRVRFGDLVSSREARRAAGVPGPDAVLKKGGLFAPPSVTIPCFQSAKGKTDGVGAAIEKSRRCGRS